MTKTFQEMFQKYRGATIAIFVFLAIASWFRLWNITSSDSITDESSLSFRAIGLIDFDAAQNQPSPWEWVGTAPAWMKLSMHDHPLLFFLVLHGSIQLFGENALSVRLPSAIFGIASIYFIFLIAKKIFDKKTAYLAATISSVNVYLVWVSRLGLQEAMVIFLILASIYFFLKGLEDDRFLLLFGIFLGLSWMTKYTTFILLPLSIVFLAFLRRDILMKKKFWLGIIIAITIFLPVIIYNFMLYKNFGHFDFQFSYLFGQNVSLWQIQPGKEEFKNIGDKFFFFFTNLKNGLSPAIFWIFWISLLSELYHLIKHKNPKQIFLSLSIGLFWIMYLIIGPTQRFLSMIVPFIIMAIAYAAVYLYNFLQKFPNVFIWKLMYFFLFTIFMANEIFFSYQTNISKKPWMYYSKDISSNFSYSGYNNLEKWISTVTMDKEPQFSFDVQYDFLKKIYEKNIISIAEKNKIPLLFVYDEDMNEAASLWSIHRRIIYHGWPMITSKKYLETMQKEGNDFFIKEGFTTIYFIVKTDFALGKKFSGSLKNSKKLVQYLNLDKKKPIEKIQNAYFQTAFLIYSLSQ